MPNEELKSSLGLLEDIEFTDEEIDKINSLLEKSLEALGEEKSRVIFEMIEKGTKDKTDMNKKDIIGFLAENMSAETSSELQSILIENKELMDYLQNLFFEKMLE